MQRLFSSTLVRFLFAGGLNTLFGLAVYTGLALTPLPTWLVLIATNVAGLVFNFITTGGLVFRDLGMERVPRFIVCYCVILATYWALLEWLSPLLGGRIGAMAVIIAPMTAATFLLQSRFVFRKAALGAKAVEP